MRILLIFPLLLLIAATNHAEIYRCNTNGKLVFSDRPCSSNPEQMSVIESSSQDSRVRLSSETAASTGKTRQLITLKFNYQIIDNDVISKEQEIRQAVALQQQLEKEHQERLESLDKEYNRIYRNSTYGKYRAQIIRQQRQEANMSYKNQMTLHRHKIDALYNDLKRLTEARQLLKERIELVKQADAEPIP